MPDPTDLLAKSAALHRSLTDAHEAIARMHRATVTGTDDFGCDYDPRHQHDLDHARALIASVLAESRAVGEHAGYLSPLPAPAAPAGDLDDEIPF